MLCFRILSFVKVIDRVTTIGVCVFRALTPVGALFNCGVLKDLRPPLLSLLDIFLKSAIINITERGI